MKDKELKIDIKPYGKFKAVEVGEPSLKNCKKCWFDQNKKHCPEGYRCSFEKNGKRVAYVFVKEEELKTNIKEAKYILSLLVKEENILSVKKQIKEMEQELKELGK